MCSTKQKHRSSVTEQARKCFRSEDSTTSTTHWISESVYWIFEFVPVSTRQPNCSTLFRSSYIMSKQKVEDCKCCSHD
ncbi:hypothetical protein ACFX2I_000571 [Malus domestica]